jgi:hypothetical protein
MMPPPGSGALSGAPSIAATLAGLASQHGAPASLTMHPGGGGGIGGGQMGPPPSMPSIAPGSSPPAGGLGGAPGMGGPPGLGGGAPPLPTAPPVKPVAPRAPAPAAKGKGPPGLKIKPAPVRVS